MLNAFLVALAVFICVGGAELIGFTMLNRPIVIGPLVGLLLGDLHTGVIIGASLEAVFMGVVNIGGASAAEPGIATAVGTAFAIMLGKGSEVALTLALPIGILGLQIKTVLYIFIVGMFAKTFDRLAAEGIDKPVLAGCIGPYSLAGRLYDMTEIMMAIYTEPDTVLLLLEKCTEFILRYCLAIKETGVAGVIMAEPAAGLLSNEDCQRYSSVYVKRIIDAVQDDSFAVILHNCGNTGHCTAAMLATGAKGYHFGNRADMITALRECPSDVWVMGNLDPVGVFRVLTPEDVFARTEELLTCTGEYANFIISTGCDTPPEVPFDNIQAFYLAVEKYNKGR